MLIISHPQFKCWHRRESKNSVTDTQLERERYTTQTLSYSLTLTFNTRFLSKFMLVLFGIFMYLGTILSTELAHRNSAMPGFPGLFIILR